MLSKKMAVSLMSLITILALAFITSPVLAAEITINLKDADGGTSGDQGDLSAKDGIQVAAGTDVTLEIKTDELFGQFPAAVDHDNDTATPSIFTVFDIIRTYAKLIEIGGF